MRAADAGLWSLSTDEEAEAQDGEAATPEPLPKLKTKLVRESDS
jgi:hypothetical protein